MDAGYYMLRARDGKKNAKIADCGIHLFEG
jgi:hypothetical protein